MRIAGFRLPDGRHGFLDSSQVSAKVLFFYSGDQCYRRSVLYLVDRVGLNDMAKEGTSLVVSDCTAARTRTRRRLKTSYG